nr:MAG TPA: hypothetical protein [Caudoviricetes sp.]
MHDSCGHRGDRGLFFRTLSRRNLTRPFFTRTAIFKILNLLKD